ncbi:MAG TPA: hypothetical protein VIU61_10105 [Kofleriaceae bacterium]
MSKGTCKFEGCSAAAVGKGYCTQHYAKWRRGALPKGRYKICTAEACRKPRANGSKCEEHTKVKAAGAEAAAAASA